MCEVGDRRWFAGDPRPGFYYKMVDDESERGGARWPAPALKTKQEIILQYPKIPDRLQAPNVPYYAAEPFPELCLPVTSHRENQRSLLQLTRITNHQTTLS